MVTAEMHLKKFKILSALCAAAFVLLFMIPIWGYLGDRFGKPSGHHCPSRPIGLTVVPRIVDWSGHRARYGSLFANQLLWEGLVVVVGKVEFVGGLKSHGWRTEEGGWRTEG
jgi:MFS family permease